MVKDTTFADTTYFDGSYLGRLELCDPKLHRYVVFTKWVTFAESTFGAACFKNAEFSSASVFSSTFQGEVDFRWAHFADESSFVGAEFHADQSLMLSGLRAEKPLRLAWKQIRGKLRKPDKLTYQTLEDNFRRLSDLDSQNESYYARRRDFEPSCVWGPLWGYGVRPLYTMCWIAAVILVSWFINISLIQNNCLRSFGSGSNRWHAAKIAFEEAWIRFPPTHYGASAEIKILIISRWLILKILEVFFLVACSNTSQVLKELVPRLYPF